MEPFYTSDVYSTTSPASSFVRGETRLGYLSPIISLTGKVIANDFAVSTARTIRPVCTLCQAAGAWPFSAELVLQSDNYLASHTTTVAHNSLRTRTMTKSLLRKFRE
jgi:hypothetical protein